MNKKMKKLGLLVVTAIAMAMGVNSASALTINDRTNNFGDPVVSDSNRGTVTVKQTDTNTYTITLNDASFVGDITVLGTEIVTINLNGKTLSSTIYNNGYLTITGNSSSIMNGTVQNNASAPKLVLAGANFANIKFNGMPKSLTVRELGTIVPSAYAGYVAGGFSTRDNKNGTHTVVELPADLSALVNALNSTTSPSVDAAHSASYYQKQAVWFTKASYAEFEKAYAAAKALVDEHTNNKIPMSRQGEIDAACEAYIASVKGLKKLANYTDLNWFIGEVEKVLSNGYTYTDATTKAMKDALANAKANLDLSKDEQSVVNTLKDALKYAYEHRALKADYSKINELEALIAGMGKERFTADSYAVYEFAQNVIERDLSDKQQGKVNDYYDNLYLAASKLKLAKNAGSTINPGTTDNDPVNPGSDEPTNPGTSGSNKPSSQGNTNNNGGSNNNSSSTVNPNTAATGTTSDVNTSDNVAVYAVMNIASLIALAGCGLVLRKQN